MSERDEEEGMTEKEKCPRKYITVETEEKKKKHQEELRTNLGPKEESVLCEVSFILQQYLRS